MRTVLTDKKFTSVNDYTHKTQNKKVNVVKIQLSTFKTKLL